MTDKHDDPIRVDIDLVKQLAELLDATKLTEIEVEDGERRVRVVRKAASAPVTYAAPAPVAAAPAPSAAPAAAPAAAAVKTFDTAANRIVGAPASSGAASGAKK